MPVERRPAVCPGHSKLIIVVYLLMPNDFIMPASLDQHSVLGFTLNPVFTGRFWGVGISNEAEAGSKHDAVKRTSTQTSTVLDAIT